MYLLFREAHQFLEEQKQINMKRSATVGISDKVYYCPENMASVIYEKRATARKPCQRITLGVRHYWIKEFTQTMACSLNAYVMAMLGSKRSKRSQCFSEMILKLFCDVLGEEFTLSTQKSKLQSWCAFIADRLGVLLGGLTCTCDARLMEMLRRAEEPAKEEAEVEEVVEEEELVVEEEAVEEEAAVEEEEAMEAEEEAMEAEEEVMLAEEEEEAVEEAAVEEAAVEEEAVGVEEEVEEEEVVTVKEEEVAEEEEALPEAAAEEEVVTEVEEVPEEEEKEVVFEEPESEELSEEKEESEEEVSEIKEASEVSEIEWPKEEEEEEEEVVEEVVEAPPAEPEESMVDIMKHVVSWIEATSPEGTPRQADIDKVVLDRLMFKVAPKDEELTDAVKKASERVSTWVDKLVASVEKDYGVTGPKEEVKPKITFRIKKDYSKTCYNVKELTPDKVCEKVKEGRSEQAKTITRAITTRPSKKPGPLKAKEMKQWAGWTSDVASVAGNWAGWLDKTCLELDESAKKHKQGSVMTKGDWAKWKKETQNRAIEWRKNKKLLKEAAELWKQKQQK